MKISILGAGYVGLVTGLCFSRKGNDVVCIDILPERVTALNKGELPIFENGLEAVLEESLEDGLFRASGDVEDIAGTDLTFICVGTPSNDGGSLNISNIKKTVREVGEVLRNKNERHTVVIKSTLPPTTTRETLIPLLESVSGKKVGQDLGVAMNPEFMREGSALQDFISPQRIIVGANDQETLDLVTSLYEGFDCPVVHVSPTTAEMIKVASNAFLATKISFINEIGNICKEIGIDVSEVAEGMGLDERIGPHFLRAGLGFGGSCLPKDVRGLIAEAEEMGGQARVLSSVLDVNEDQPMRVVELLEQHMDLEGKTIAVLGLAFKPQTDDVRETRTLPVVRALKDRGAKLKLHDPEAMDNFRELFSDGMFCATAEECVEGSDAVVIATEWPQYSDPALYGDRLVIDGRRVVNTKNYEGICW